MDGSTPDRILFTHVALEGTPYQAGRQQAEMLLHDPQRIPYLTPTLPFLDPFSDREAQRALAYFDRYCPGIGEELQGAADVFGIPVQQVAFLGGKNKENGSSTIPVGGPVSRGSGHCSHFTVLPSASENGHLYMGQNEDSSPNDLDLRLCTTRVQGKPAHIGFSDMIFGRVQGMNEFGFAVTTSWGAPGVWLPGEGLPYFVAVRALLDRCHTVDEAVQVLADLPIAWCTNFIVADRSGEAALVEVASAHRGVRRIPGPAQEQFLCATNQYTLPEMIPYDTSRRKESLRRYKTIVSRLSSAIPHVSRDTVRGILSEPIPKGLCMHYYSSGLGTLWSMVFDLTDTMVDICFGAPDSSENSWHTFGLQDPGGATEYVAHVPDEPAAPEFWGRLPPGAGS